MGKWGQLIGLFGLMGAFLMGCSQGALSERDQKLEQLRLQADAKRRELQQVVGDYEGQSIQSTGVTHDVLLNLAIKEVPTLVEGFPDPVPFPNLSGSFKFYIGALGSLEYFVVSIDKAGYNAAQNFMEMVGSHPEYKEFLISLSRNETQLTGDWSAPSTAQSGKLILKRVSNND